MLKHVNKKIKIFGFCAIVVLFTCTFYFKPNEFPDNFLTKNLDKFLPKSDKPIDYKLPKFCYFNRTWTDGLTFQDFRENKKLTQGTPKVIFHETTCIEDGIATLRSRRACAVESAALHNPDREIFLLFTAPVGFRNTTPMPILDALLSYPNVHFNHIHLIEYAEGTLLEEWMKTETLLNSTYVRTHTSDVLRFISLYKYGGTYLDLDTVTLIALNRLEPNYAGVEAVESLNSGIINLENDRGHEIAAMFLNEILTDFRGKDWGWNGPGVITRVSKKLCKTESVYGMVDKKVCEGFHVMNRTTCCEFDGWSEVHKFFQPQFLNEVLNRLTNAVIAHVWNTGSSKMNLTVESEVAYIHLARKHCPKVIANSHDF